MGILGTGMKSLGLAQKREPKPQFSVNDLVTQPGDPDFVEGQFSSQAMVPAAAAEKSLIVNKRRAERTIALMQELGIEPPDSLREIREKGFQSKKPGFFGRVLDTLDAPRRLISFGLQDLLTGDTSSPTFGDYMSVAFGSGSEEAIRKQRERFGFSQSGSDLLKALGIDEAKTLPGKIARGGLHFLTDVLIDPLTYVTFGASAVGRKVLAAEGRSFVERLSSRVISEVAEGAPSGGVTAVYRDFYEKAFAEAAETVKKEVAAEVATNALREKIANDVLQPLIAKDFRKLEKNLGPELLAELPAFARGGARISVPFGQKALSKGLTIPGTRGVGRAAKERIVGVLDKKLGSTRAGAYFKSVLETVGNQLDTQKALLRGVSEGRISGYQYLMLMDAYDLADTTVKLQGIASRINSYERELMQAVKDAGIDASIDDVSRMVWQAKVGVPLKLGDRPVPPELERLVYDFTSWSTNFMEDIAEQFKRFDPDFNIDAALQSYPGTLAEGARRLLQQIASAGVTPDPSKGDQGTRIVQQILNAVGSGGYVESTLGDDAYRYATKFGLSPVVMTHNESNILFFDREFLMFKGASAPIAEAIEQAVESISPKQYFDNVSLNNEIEAVMADLIEKARAAGVALPSDVNPRIFVEDPFQATFDFMKDMASAVQMRQVFETLSKVGLVADKAKVVNVQATIARMAERLQRKDVQEMIQKAADEASGAIGPNRMKRIKNSMGKNYRKWRSGIQNKVSRKELEDMDISDVALDYSPNTPELANEGVLNRGYGLYVKDDEITEFLPDDSKDFWYVRSIGSSLNAATTSEQRKRLLDILIDFASKTNEVDWNDLIDVTPNSFLRYFIYTNRVDDQTIKSIERGTAPTFVYDVLSAMATMKDNEFFMNESIRRLYNDLLGVFQPSRETIIRRDLEKLVQPVLDLESVIGTLKPVPRGGLAYRLKFEMLPIRVWDVDQKEIITVIPKDAIISKTEVRNIYSSVYQLGYTPIGYTDEAISNVVPDGFTPYIGTMPDIVFDMTGGAINSEIDAVLSGEFAYLEDMFTASDGSLTFAYRVGDVNNIDERILDNIVEHARANNADSVILKKLSTVDPDQRYIDVQSYTSRATNAAYDSDNLVIDEIRNLDRGEFNHSAAILNPKTGRITFVKANETIDVGPYGDALEKVLKEAKLDPGDIDLSDQAAAARIAEELDQVVINPAVKVENAWVTQAFVPSKLTPKMIDKLKVYGMARGTDRLEIYMPNGFVAASIDLPSYTVRELIKTNQELGEDVINQVTKQIANTIPSRRQAIIDDLSEIYGADNIAQLLRTTVAALDFNENVNTLYKIIERLKSNLRTAEQMGLGPSEINELSAFDVELLMAQAKYSAEKIGLSPRDFSTVYTKYVDREGFVDPRIFAVSGSALRGKQVQRDVAIWFEQLVRNMQSVYTPVGLQQLKQTSNSVINWWKGMATVTRPGFHVRNLVSAIWNNQIAGVTPKDYLLVRNNAIKLRKALRTAQNFDEALEAIKDPKARLLFKEAWDQGILLTSFSRAEYRKILDNQEMSSLRKTLNFVNPFAADDFGLVRGGAQVMESIEDFVRMATFAAWIDLSSPEAARATAKVAREMTLAVHFDYQNLTEFETIIKKFVPFFVWTRRNLPLQLQVMLERPGIATRYSHLMQAVGQAGEDVPQDNFPQNRYWSAQAVGTDIVLNENTPFWARIMFDPQLPITDLLAIDPLSPGEAMNNFLELLGPQFTLPFDLAKQADYGDINAPAPLNVIARQLAVLGIFDERVTADGDFKIPYSVRTIWNTVFPFAREVVEAPIGPTDPKQRAALGDTPDSSSLLRRIGLQLGRGLGVQVQTPAMTRGPAFDAQDEISDILKKVKQSGAISAEDYEDFGKRFEAFRRERDSARAK